MPGHGLSPHTAVVHPVKRTDHQGLLRRNRGDILSTSKAMNKETRNIHRRVLYACISSQPNHAIAQTWLTRHRNAPKKKTIREFINTKTAFVFICFLPDIPVFVNVICCVRLERSSTSSFQGFSCIARHLTPLQEPSRVSSIIRSLTFLSFAFLERIRITTETRMPSKKRTDTAAVAPAMYRHRLGSSDTAVPAL